MAASSHAQRAGSVHSCEPTTIPTAATRCVLELWLQALSLLLLPRSPQSALRLLLVLWSLRRDRWVWLEG